MATEEQIEAAIYAYNKHPHPREAMRAALAAAQSSEPLPSTMCENLAAENRRLKAALAEHHITINIWRAVASEGTQLKREQLAREIARLPNETDRANLSHTMSKLFMFLEDDLEEALKEAARNPYR